jgi:diguanylate cyclase (GGDEF)-like protein
MSERRPPGDTPELNSGRDEDTSGPGLEPLRRRPRVLLVDDEPGNLQLLARALREEFEAVMVESGVEAQKILDGPMGPHIDVVVADQRMPELTGTELLAWVSDRLPRVRRLIVTAFADASVMLEAINRVRVDRFMLKPIAPRELVEALRELLARDDESPRWLAEENARARLRQELLEERNIVLRRRAGALERAMELQDEGGGGASAAATGEQRASGSWPAIDLLTGLGSTAALRDWLARAAPLAAGGSELSLLAADVDELEALNLGRGRDAGDAAILDLGDALAQVLGDLARRPGEAPRPAPEVHVARMRGGRFVGALLNVSRQEALEAAHQVCSRYAILTSESASRVPHTASFGVASLPRDAETVEDLLMKAEVALYTAKAAGKNRAVGY